MGKKHSRSKKGTASSSSVELSAERARKIYDELRDLHVERWQLGQDFVQSVQSLEPLERAVAWLKHVARNEDVYVGQEAVVYLVSRGYDCTDCIKGIAGTWKRDERRVLDTYAYEQQQRYGRDVSHVEASDILERSMFGLQDFWESHPPQAPSFIATMLRTVEWCGIGGFDHWWHSFERQVLEGLFRYGSDPVPASFLLFDLCRSDYALQLMHKALDRLLDAIELPDYGQPHPWRRRDESTHGRAVDSFPYAASIVFASKRLRPWVDDTELSDQAVQFLLRHQNDAGAWRYSADDRRPDICSTAMVIHALAIARPRGWELAASAARQWLWSVQDKSGCWIEFGYDSVYLTVLVLDAFELAADSTKITFTVQAHGRVEKTDQDAVLSAILRRLDEMHLDLGIKLDDLKRGQEAIYRRIGGESQLVLDSILKEIRQGRIEQGQLQRTVDSIRRALKRIQEIGLPIDDEDLARSLDQIYHAVNSDLPFQQKLELSIPIVPLLLGYKIELGAAVDLGGVWEELIKSSQRLSHRTSREERRER